MCSLGQMRGAFWCNDWLTELIWAGDINTIDFRIEVCSWREFCVEVPNSVVRTSTVFVTWKQYFFSSQFRGRVLNFLNHFTTHSQASFSILEMPPTAAYRTSWHNKYTSPLEPSPHHIHQHVTQYLLSNEWSLRSTTTQWGSRVLYGTMKQYTMCINAHTWVSF